MSDQSEALLKEIFKAIPVKHKLAFLRETLISLDPELRKQLFRSLHETKPTPNPPPKNAPPVRRRMQRPNSLYTPPVSIATAQAETSTAPARTNRPQQPSAKPAKQAPVTTANGFRSNRETAPPEAAVVSSQAELERLHQEPQEKKDQKIEDVLKKFEQEKVIMLATDQTNIKKELFMLLLWIVGGLTALIGLAVGTRSLFTFLGILD